MRELVLIFPDLYLPPEREGPMPAAPLPGLEELLRFAARETLPAGWRAWLCHSVGRGDLAALAPAALAAAGDPATGHAATGAGRLWLAEPVHLRAGLTRVQLAADGLLRLTAPEAESLAADFATTFGASGLALQPLSAGNFLLRGLEAEAHTEDPARHLGADIDAALPQGAAAAALRRLASEVELWLYTHPVNRERARTAALAVSSLWIWGGGEAPAYAAGGQPVSLPMGIGDEASFTGLWRLCGHEVRPLPGSLDELDAGSAAQVIAVVGRAPGSWDPGALEQRWLAPAAGRLARRELAMLTLVVNDRVFRVRPRDRLRFWCPRRRWVEQLR